MDIVSNPFELIICKLQDIEGKISNLSTPAPPSKFKLVDRAGLRNELGVTDQTIISWEKKGVINRIGYGGVIRYNLFDVLEALNNKKRRVA